MDASVMSNIAWWSKHRPGICFPEHCGTS